MTIAAMKKARKVIQIYAPVIGAKDADDALAMLDSAIVEQEKCEPVACVDTKTEFSNYTTIQTDELYISNYEPLGENGLVLGAQLYLHPAPVPAGLPSEMPEILREAADILAKEKCMRFPIIDELYGFAAMLAAAPKEKS